jgi:hypothetical protein
MAQQTLNRDKLGFWAANVGDLEAFAELVRADEREACAKVVEASPSYDWHKFACEAASAIRARSNT